MARHTHPCDAAHSAENPMTLTTERRALGAGIQPVSEPMNRYTYPIRISPLPSCPPENGDMLHTRILETLLEQNQLLVDLTSAVNSLTAAVLNNQHHQ